MTSPPPRIVPVLSENWPLVDSASRATGEIARVANHAAIDTVILFEHFHAIAKGRLE